MISSIFNFLILFLILSGCAAIKKLGTEDETNVALDEALKDVAQQKTVVDVGPTNKHANQFLDKTKEYGLDLESAIAFYVVDLNFDRWQDLVILPDYFSIPRFYIFDPLQKKFIKSDKVFLPQDVKASFLTFGDLNRDGVIDVLVGVLNQRNELSKIPIDFYLGISTKEGLSFKKSDKFIKLEAAPTSSISLLDFDLDGKLDFFVANWFHDHKGNMVPTADALIRQTDDGFEDVTFMLRGESKKNADEIYPLNAKPTYGSSTCDIDQNGFPDILTVSSAGMSNKLWMNLGTASTSDRFFEDAAPSSGYAADPDGLLVPRGGGRSFFSACTDYNDDGIMDIFLGELTHSYDNESVDRSSILTGAKPGFPPSFLRTEYLSDVTSENWNQGDKRATWWDYNLDSRIDLLVDNSGFPPDSRLVLFEQDETNAFVNIANQLGIDVSNPTGTVILDVNKDGKVDILTGQHNLRKAEMKNKIYLFENNQKLIGHRSFKVTLYGKRSNKEALGAMVHIYLEKGREKIIQRRWYEFSQGGLPSQHEKSLFVGVPPEMELKGFKIRWPIRKKETYRGGVALEKLYPVKDDKSVFFKEISLCETGEVIEGPFRCSL